MRAGWLATGGQRAEGQTYGSEEGRLHEVVSSPLVSFPRSPLHHVEDRDALGEGHVIPVRIYQPRPPTTPRPICVYFHGGGFCTGSLRSHDGLCSRIAHQADCVVVAVDYRLAPEHRFPAAALDAIAAYDWDLERAKTLHKALNLAMKREVEHMLAADPGTTREAA